ncbi:hypothetical protein CkaCkLH20_11805 [Colletotrichum karsti]|uniref:Orc1-like AAA ATPase domain-containing protein n=1 Tax=Colletotrichum karsti TaxID=1095194 RepID=A0A9P6LER7_9PEZI|nr:uncharacterized protein CkaCkLH20_11805 [Colletotrichum karsti]KAF9870703.1 hypothetical protein CkaCkLH20_11805 [Colletotrichum karsti]
MTKGGPKTNKTNSTTSALTKRIIRRYWLSGPACSSDLYHGFGEQGCSSRHAAATLSGPVPVDRDAWARLLGAAVSNEDSGKHGIRISIGVGSVANLIFRQHHLHHREVLLHISATKDRYVGAHTQNTSKQDTRQTTKDNTSKSQDGGGDSLPRKMLESAATSFASILVLAAGFAVAGYAYHKTYKRIVLNKMTRAFTPGDPVLELAAIGKEVPQTPAEADDRWVQRPEQARIDKIVNGSEVGHYFLILGEKGTGKSSMLIEAMRKIDGDGVAMFEAHADLEIVRIRLGKALDFEFHEDYIGGYFSERGPRDTTALLDIERALNKLEKVALVNRKERKKPLVVIINQMHLIRDDEDGKDLIELLQQRAEQWAAANLVTMVFNTDDYWVYERLKQLATRMEVMSVRDLTKRQAIAALWKYRMKYFNERLSQDKLEEVYDLVGGRLSFLNRVAKSKDMIATCDQICLVEKTWFLNQCWILGAEMDDDVMDQQKWAAGAMTLAQALVDKEEDMDKTYDRERGHLLPSFPMHKAQQIMTRSDFVRDMDRLNLFSIAADAQVRASSVPMHHAFQEICAEEGFRDHLQKTVIRIGDIESLGRTRELVAKDLVLGGKYEIKRDKDGVVVKLVEGEDRGMYV